MKHSLELLLKLMILVVFIAVLIVLGAQVFTGNQNESEPVVVSLANMPLGSAKAVQWEGERLWLVKRSKKVILPLGDLDNVVQDPESLGKPLPETFSLRHRGLLPDYLLVFAKGEQCEVSYVNENADQANLPATWIGGFYDACADQWYDLAGRAYDHGRYADHLIVPEYRIVGAVLILGE